MAEQLSLEESLKKLESLIDVLEKGQMGIDEAIETYAQGMKLSSALRRRLEELSAKVNAISNEANSGAQSQDKGASL